jgi:hypothetical protein
MTDERTEKMYELFKGKDSKKWNDNAILNLELAEYDAYRWFKFICDENAEIGNRINNRIAKAQAEELSSNNTKLFRVNPSLNHLLLLTKSSKIEQEIKMPFNNIFIDTDLKLNENIRIMGIFLILVTKEDIRDLNNQYLKIAGKEFYPNLEKSDYAQCSCLFYDKERDEFAFIDENINLNNGKHIPKVEELNGINNDDKFDKIIRKELRNYVLNFLLFLNEPRVTMYIQEPNNQRRERKGLIPIPSLLKTKIEVGLENYIEKIYFNGLSHSKLGFSFWVRGHWRRFLSPRFVNKQGQKIWIAPHISGEGLMPPQVFEVTTKKLNNKNVTT